MRRPARRLFTLCSALSVMALPLALAGCTWPSRPAAAEGTHADTTTATPAMATTAPATTAPAVPAPPDDEYAKVYDLWWASVEAELKDGRSILFGNWTHACYLADRARQHLPFLREKLEQNGFTVMILEHSDLNAEVQRLYGYADGLYGRRRNWLRFLAGDVPAARAGGEARQGEADAEPRGRTPEDSLVAYEFDVPPRGWTVLAFSPDGDRLAVAEEKTVRLRDGKTGRPLDLSIHHGNQVQRVTFSPDRKRIVTVTHGAIHFWDAATGKPARPDFKFDPLLEVVGFTPDGKRVLLLRQEAQLVDLNTGKSVLPPLRHATPKAKSKRRLSPWLRAATTPQSYLYTAILSPDGTKVLTSGSDETARLWDAATGEALLPPMPHHGAAGERSPPIFSEDGTRVFTIGPREGDHAGIVWDVATGREIARLGKHPIGNRVTHAAFSPNGKRVATGGSNSRCHVWDAATGKPATRWLRIAGDEVWRVSFSPDGRKLLVEDRDLNAGIQFLFDATSGEKLHSTNDTYGAFSPDGELLLTIDYEDGIVRAWDLRKLDELDAAERANGR